MDKAMKKAAENGKVTKLYELIEKDGNVLRQIDEVEFVDTPLHTAAENEHIEFAMEIMVLKPSFARKLNPQGLSPLHLAVKQGKNKMALRLMEIDKDLVRVRGKNGKTPLHYLSEVENQHSLLDSFLKACPECIKDITTQNRTALHIAVKNNKPAVLEVLLPSNKNNEYNEYYKQLKEAVNRKDKAGNTALHIAAREDQTQIFRKLLNYGANKDLMNDDKKTALDVARNPESIRRILNSIATSCNY